MKTKNILFVALIVLLAGMVSCKKDHDVPTGKVFNGGSGGGSTTDSLTISVTANPSEGGTVSGGGKYLKGKTCVVAASANEGYVFSNWTENGTQVSTSVSYSFTVDADRALVANFSVSTGNNFTITAVASPEYGGVISGSGTYQQGQNCTVIATAEAGYTFVNWTENGSQVSTEASYTFTVTGNRTLVANFTLCDYTNIILNELNGETKFIEIYNKGTSDVPLNGMYIMKDDYVAGSIWTADVTIVAPAGGYVLLYSEHVAIDYPEYPEALIFHSGLSSKKSIRVTLFMPDGTVRDEFTRGTIGEWGQAISDVAPQSYARTPNGGDWKLANPTPGEANPSTGEDIPDVETPVNYTVTVSANPGNGGTVTGGGIYQQGQTCTVTAVPANGYAFTWWYELISDEGGGNYVPVSSDANYSFTVNGDCTLRADFTYNGGGNGPTGAINGKFTINANGDKVYFSMGNLQYHASTNTWRFAENQWDYVGTQTPNEFGNVGGTVAGSDNGNISQTYNGWIDLFGWGTSGYNHGAVCYQPWSISETDSDYLAYGNWQYNLYDQTGQADWGWNAISNGGNTTNTWRTLTGGSIGEWGEWNYIFNSRTTPSGIRYAKAQVNNVNGVILLPDDWSASYYSLSNTNQGGASYNSNVISSTQWNTLEQHGAVFLPAGGYRPHGTSVYNVGGYGSYWSASNHDVASNCVCVDFNDSSLGPHNSYGRFSGQSVRLVRSAEN